MGRVLDQLNISQQDKLKNLNVPVSLWGNGVLDGLSYHHEYDRFAFSFEGIKASFEQPPEVFLIVGPINKLQLKDLVQEIDRVKDLRKTYVVYVEGLLSKRVLKFSDGAVSDLRNYVNIDLEYHKHPVQLDELVQEILRLIKGNDEK